MSKITINGINISGSSIVVSGNKIVVDGKDVTPDAKEININVEGNIEQIQADYCTKISVAGNAKNIKTTSGEVHVGGDLGGSIQTTSGDIDCQDVKGNITTVSGDVSCSVVSGSVSTISGDIKNKK